MLGTSKLTRVVIVTAIVAAGALAIAALIGLAAGGFQPRQLGRVGTTIDERKSLPLDGVDLVSISSVSDDVRVVEGDGTGVDAWFHGTAGSASADSLPHLVVERSGATVDIRLERKRPFSLGFFWSDLRLEVTVPRGYARSISVTTTSADMELPDHAFDVVTLSTTSGEVKTGALSASDFKAHSTSGDVRVSGLTARRADLSSVSGEVRMESAKAETTVRTVSGDVTLAFSAAPAAVDAESTSGEITMTLPADAAFTLDARSTSGDVRCQFPITISESRNGGGSHVLAGTVGAGTGKISARTVSGDIRIQR
jgi:lia operon protein LiaG